MDTILQEIVNEFTTSPKKKWYKIKGSPYVVKDKLNIISNRGIDIYVYLFNLLDEHHFRFPKYTNNINNIEYSYSDLIRRTGTGIILASGYKHCNINMKSLFRSLYKTMFSNWIVIVVD